MEAIPPLRTVLVLLALAASAGCATWRYGHPAPVDPVASYPTGSWFGDLTQDVAAASMYDWNFRKLGW